MLARCRNGHVDAVGVGGHDGKHTAKPANRRLRLFGGYFSLAHRHHVEFTQTLRRQQAITLDDGAGHPILCHRVPVFVAGVISVHQNILVSKVIVTGGTDGPDPRQDRRDSHHSTASQGWPAEG